MRPTRVFGLLGLSLVAAAGCNAFDSAGGEGELPSSPEFGFAAGSGGFPAPPSAAGGRPVPPPAVLDDRPVVTAAHPPPPIEGGTLLVTRDDALAVAADADRDRILVVDLQAAAVQHEIALKQGDVPGRLVEDGAGRIHVVLRSSGALATVDPRAGEVLGRRDVCGVPRGIDYRATSDSVLVACADGKLVELPAALDDAREVQRLQVEPDLQDVVVDGERLYVTTFKRAELLELDATGGVLARSTPATLTGPFESLFAPPLERAQTLEPAVAWASVKHPAGGVAMVHQRAQLEQVDISTATTEGDAHGMPGTPGPGPGQGRGGYGSGGLGCDGIVQSSVTMMGGDGSVRSLPPILKAVLPVDGAVSPDGRFMAVAVAGSTGEPSPSGALMEPFLGSAGALLIDLAGSDDPRRCMIPGFGDGGATLSVGQTVGVAFDSGGRLVVQSRQPSMLRLFSDFEGCMAGACPADLELELGGVPMQDTGHDLFHVDAGGGIACASCHPGGGDDGRTWNFSELGPRRTQLFNMGIEGTEPLHWDGDMETLDMLMEEVFSRRMGGALQTPSRVAAMAEWIESLSPNPPPRPASDPAVLRGRTLFESETVGCASCHNGSKLSNNQTVDVGTGGAFQVPSLVGVAYHQPYIHTGCAETLHQRFDPSCGGGDKHGRTSQLSAAQVDDLVAYLESL